MNTIQMLLPGKIYAVPGFEINIYFQNILTTINPANYAFEVTCQKGRTDAVRWRWTPDDADIGNWPLQVTVWDDRGKVAEGSSELVVSPRDAGAGREISLLGIGASAMAAKGHFDHLWQRFQSAGNPKLRMLGSHGPGYLSVVPGGPANEAYGGWSWNTFFTKTCSAQLDNDGLHPSRPWDVPSPFLFPTDGGVKFDFSAYLDRFCDGIKPDFILFELGINSIFLAHDDMEFEKIQKKEMLPFMEKMFAEIRKIVPDVDCGVSLIPAGSWSQDAFGANYGTMQSRRRWLRNADLLCRFYIEQEKSLGYTTVPLYINNDGDANYPTVEEPRFAGSSTLVRRAANALHATPEGYSQWADSEYFWLKHRLCR